MKILVLHAERNRQSGDIVGFKEVASVDVTGIGGTTTDLLEYAYRWTNNVMGSWSIKKEYLEGIGENGDYNTDVTVLNPREDGYGQRSTMMGDRMIISDIDPARLEQDGATYEVSMIGFKEVA